MINVVAINGRRDKTWTGKRETINAFDGSSLKQAWPRMSNKRPQLDCKICKALYECGNPWSMWGLTRQTTLQKGDEHGYAQFRVEPSRMWHFYRHHAFLKFYSCDTKPLMSLLHMHCSLLKDVVFREELSANRWKKGKLTVYWRRRFLYSFCKLRTCLFGFIFNGRSTCCNTDVSISKSICPGFNNFSTVL